MLKNLDTDSKYTIFVMSNNNKYNNMKKYKVKEVIELLKADKWYLDYWKGDHRQFRHPVKETKVTVRGKLSETVSQENLNSIWKQAGWK
jgi:predicted RNA binding protein YcfA (HicA-like mRNA interferase family)